jgi:DNA repair protein RadC
MSLTAKEKRIVDQALHILMAHMRKAGAALVAPDLVRDYLRLQLASEVNEWFCIILLDNQNRVLTFKRLFQGSINSCSVHPRVIVQEALQHNAAAIIIAHNHPSGSTEPSQNDRVLTGKIQEAMELISVKLLDHFIVAKNQIVSFTERGLL